MTTQDLISELNTCLGTVAAERSSFEKGLSQLVKQFEAVRKDRLKMLKNESCKAKRKSLKKDLRTVERVLQQVS